MHDINQETVKESYKILKQLYEEMTQYKNGWVKPDCLLEQCRKISNDHKAIEATLESIASAANIPVILVDMWYEEESAEIIYECIWNALESLGKLVKKQRDQGCLPDLLSGKKDFGAPFIPVKLLRQVFSLGEAVLSLQEGHQTGSNIEQLGIDIMESSAEWVKVIRKRWGTPPDYDCIPVKPIEVDPMF